MDKKNSALAYLQSKGVMQVSEAMMNALCVAQPASALPFMVDYLTQHAGQAVIEKIVAHEVLSSSGAPTLMVELWCTQLERSKLAASVTCPLGSHTLSEVGGEWKCLPVGTDPLYKVDAGNAAWYQRKGVADVAHDINTTLSALLAGRSLHGLAELDADLWSSDSSSNKDTIGGNALTAVSLALALTSASLASASLFQIIKTQAHIAQSLRSTNPQIAVSGTFMPAPLAAVFSPKLAGGKLKIRGVHLCPPPHLTVKYGLHNIVVVTNFIKELIGKKGGLAATSLTPEGSFTFVVDKLEQAFDLITEATTLAGLHIGHHVCVYLDYGGAATWDAAKSKYEIVQGQLKTADDLVNDICELISTRHEVIGIQDPFRSEDEHAYAALAARLDPRCIVVTSDSSHARETGNSGSTANINQSGTVSRLVERTAALTNVVYEVSPLGDAGCIEQADLAVGVSARFLKAGGVARERVALYNRLLQIEAHLHSSGELQQRDALDMPPPATLPTSPSPRRKKATD